ncbi:hypothetical protein F0562_005601 [Nyssa sinensis]|uniref:Cytochrome P450 n=1 Tax=Nyssa sinensis TaxID=561372 RepID=A0A5J5AJW1_9ASTE|nr:hypothetical protein F0562_005601 [Nyssa sinensis]
MTGYLEILLVVICFVFLCRFGYNNGLPWNWPLFGMLPMVLLNFNRLQKRFTEILELSNGTFLFKGPLFVNMDMIITSNPANVHHIMSKNFTNYPKGSQSKEIFDILGHSLFNQDLGMWREQRKLAHAFFNDQRFHQFTPKINQHTLEKGLVPVLDHASKHGTVVDLQDLLQRLMFDATCMLATGYDPGSLRIGLPDVPFSKAMDDATEAILFRHILPERFWKLQRWLGVWKEKKMSKAMETLDHIAENYISMKRRELSTGAKTKEDEEGFNALRCCLTEDDIFGSAMNTNKATRDCILGLIFAGRDTASSVLAWFFRLVMKNPLVETKIREELKANLPINEAEKFGLFNGETLNKLVYLHATLCETLRLFPPVPFQRRVAIQPDILPSGHRVDPKTTKVVLSSYAMGRTKSIWGNDSLEFKPERWVLEKDLDTILDAAATKSVT